MAITTTNVNVELGKEKISVPFLIPAGMEKKFWDFLKIELRTRYTNTDEKTGFAVSSIAQVWHFIIPYSGDLEPLRDGMRMHLEHLERKYWTDHVVEELKINPSLRRNLAKIIQLNGLITPEFA